MQKQKGKMKLARRGSPDNNGLPPMNPKNPNRNLPASPTKVNKKKGK